METFLRAKLSNFYRIFFYFFLELISPNPYDCVVVVKKTCSRCYLYGTARVISKNVLDGEDVTNRRSGGGSVLLGVHRA